MSSDAQTSPEAGLSAKLTALAQAIDDLPPVRYGTVVVRARLEIHYQDGEWRARVCFVRVVAEQAGTTLPEVIDLVRAQLRGAHGADLDLPPQP